MSHLNQVSLIRNVNFFPVNLFSFLLPHFYLHTTFRYHDQRHKSFLRIIPGNYMFLLFSANIILLKDLFFWHSIHKLYQEATDMEEPINLKWQQVRLNN